LEATEAITKVPPTHIKPPIPTATTRARVREDGPITILYTQAKESEVNNKTTGHLAQLIQFLGSLANQAVSIVRGRATTIQIKTVVTTKPMALSFRAKILPWSQLWGLRRA
jgi:hypothetical protein|tara:strand:+ start:7155 stop:7487 length:333 start_codon:yes stop_codon:yes gene_type:complete